MQTQQEITFDILKYQLTKDVVGSAFSSYNFYHAGMDELTYEAGLMTELIDRILRFAIVGTFGFLSSFAAILF